MKIFGEFLSYKVRKILNAILAFTMMCASVIIIGQVLLQFWLCFGVKTAAILAKKYAESAGKL